MAANNQKKIKTEESNVCFVLSPIGEDGTEKHKKFKEIYEHLIKPSIETTGFDLKVLRADEILHPGSFIKDILENIYDAFIVIADLTTQNPNVFYELGVRHSLVPRTILIAQSINDVPADLREYRTIIYKTTLKGGNIFRKRMKKCIKEIMNNPQRPDNPVLDRLGNVIENKTIGLSMENIKLKKQVEDILSKGFHNIPKSEQMKINKVEPFSELISTRVGRILSLLKAQKQSKYKLNGEGDGTVIFGKGKNEYEIKLKTEQGNFNLYFIMEKGIIKEYWYLSINNIGRIYNVMNDLADIRVLLEQCKTKENLRFVFIIATDKNLTSESNNIQKAFKKMLSFLNVKIRFRFNLEIWDEGGLLKKEKEYGIRF
ncbi:MAG: hypothetical protein NT145_00025 [Elusimicrobia bacterium]|nr:hypothetical protein [Elusimicrobiota bacterium]